MVASYIFSFVLAASPLVLAGPSNRAVVDRSWHLDPPPPRSHCNPFTSPISCFNHTSVAPSCCFSSPGGQILSTQFWDYQPVGGPAKTWTLHGLWPDHCDSTYDQFCTPSQEIYNVTGILTQAKQTNLLAKMNKYWISTTGTNEAFWEHEFNKHATCMNTLTPSCFNNSHYARPDVVAFFNQAFRVYETLPTYEFLAARGIVPSTSRNYTLKAVQAAVKAATGHTAQPQCDKSGALTEIWYSFAVQGSIADGIFYHIEPANPYITCPPTLRYLPKVNATSKY